MILMNTCIDLFQTINQFLVAQDWETYQYKIIISEELRFDIESFYEEYQVGIISKTKLTNLILNILQQEFKGQNN